MSSINMCLSCGRPIHAETEAVCSELCRDETVEAYELMIYHAPDCRRNHPGGDAENFHKKIIGECELLIEKLKNAPVVNKIEQED